MRIGLRNARTGVAQTGIIDQNPTSTRSMVGVVLNAIVRSRTGHLYPIAVSLFFFVQARHCRRLTGNARMSSIPATNPPT
jgi:hypothetical protein